MLAANGHQAEQLSDRLFRGSWYTTAFRGQKMGARPFWYLAQVATNNGNMRFILFLAPMLASLPAE